MNEAGKQKLAEAQKIASETIGHPKFWDTDQLRLALALVSLTNEMANRKMTTADIDDLDSVVHELGIEDSHVTPAEAVRELKQEIEDLRQHLAAAQATPRKMGDSNET